MKLNKKEEQLKEEIEHIKDISYKLRRDKHADRITILQIERDALIRSRVLLDCLMIEEVMSLIIMDYVLHDSTKWRSIKYFGRIKRYRMLYEKILAHIPPFQKLKMLKEIINLSRNIERILRRIFDLRNVLAHVLTIDYSKEQEVEYAGKTIFDVDGFEKYVEEANQAVIFLLGKLKL